MIVKAPFLVTDASKALVDQHKNNFVFSSKSHDEDDVEWHYFVYNQIIISNGCTVKSYFNYAISTELKVLRRWTMAEVATMRTYQRKMARKAITQPTTDKETVTQTKPKRDQLGLSVNDGHGSSLTKVFTGKIASMTKSAYKTKREQFLFAF